MNHDSEIASAAATVTLASGAATAFALASLALADAIGEYHFTERELAILHVLRRLSFGRGRYGVLIPSRKYFEPIGITSGNASEILKRLEKVKRVIEERPANYFSLIVPPAAWHADPKRGVARMMEQLELDITQPQLRDALRVTFVESFAIPSPAGAGEGGQRPGEGRGDEPTLPTRLAVPSEVRSDRSAPGEDVPQGPSGVTTRESAGSETTRSGESPAGGQPLPSALKAGASSTMNPQLAAAVQKLGAAVFSHCSPGYSHPLPNREPGGRDAPSPDVRSRFGNPPRKPMPARLLPAAPESGTRSPLKALNSSAVQSSETTELLKGGRLTETQRELRARIEQLVGGRAWTNWGGAWTNAIKREAGLVQRVVAQFTADAREGKVIPNPGGYMWDLLKRWRAAR